MTISNLKNILIPPALPNENGNGETWPLIDDKLEFPEDYVEFISAYGTGRIADFIALFNPFSKNEDLNFFDQETLVIEDFNYLIQEDAEYYKYILYPNDGGLLPLGVTDNGDYLFWVVNDKGNSNSWKTAIVASRSPDVEYFEENITSLIFGVLSKNIKPDSFPVDFPYKIINFDKI